MSDNQRRTICRILFLAMCVLPTSAIGYWICHPQTADGWERAIQAHLRVTTEIHSVETPGPYVTILRGLTLFDLDGETLFTTVTARIEFGREYNRVVIPNTVKGLTNEGLDYLVHSINQNVVRKRSVEKPWIVLLEKNTTIKHASTTEFKKPNAESRASLVPISPDSSLTVSELSIRIGPDQPDTMGTRATANFKVIGADGNAVSDKFVQCDIYRTDLEGHGMHLHTNDSMLPVWLLANQRVDLASKLGQSATFKGEVRYQPTPSNPSLEVAGVFNKVSLVTSISGVSQNNASIWLNHCQYTNGKLAIWDAVLYPDAESLPKRIDQKHLFMTASQLDIAGAITQAWFGPEMAQRESDSNYH